MIDDGGGRAWVAAFAASFAEQRAALDELDRRSGDGDFGSNLLPAIEGAAAGAEGLAPGRALAQPRPPFDRGTQQLCASSCATAMRSSST